MSTTFYPLASLSQIERTPSREDGIPEDLEEDLRANGCKLIQQAGILLDQYARFYSGLSLGPFERGFGVQKAGGRRHGADTFSAVLVCFLDETV
jgi:hypothetical protein